MRKLVLTGLLVVFLLIIGAIGPSKNIYADGQRFVALTFDDGPSDEYTPRILKILEKHEVLATFFLVGKEVENHPNIAKEIIASGHQVENHTYSHPKLEPLNEQEVLIEMIKAEEAYQNVLGMKETSFFRPPRKVLTDDVIRANERTGKKLALWEVCVENRKAKNPEAMLRRVEKYAPYGGVILLHDGSPGIGIQKENRENTVKVLPLIIQAYKEKGYKFVTLEEYYQNTVDIKAFPYELGTEE